MFRISKHIGFAIVLIVLASAVPLYAQKAGPTLESLSSQISVLFRVQQRLLFRVTALETAEAQHIKQEHIVLVATPTPTPTPTPSPTPYDQTLEDWTRMTLTLERDASARGIDIGSMSFAEVTGSVETRLSLAYAAMRNCELSMKGVLDLVHLHGQVIDDTGIPEKTGMSARFDILAVLAQPVDSAPDCEQIVKGRVQHIMDKYGKQGDPDDD